MDERTLYSLKGELQGARNKFPTNEHKLAALMEEVGELAQAMIDHSRGKGSPLQVYTEAIQVAAMAVRLAEEGDASFPYEYSYECYRDFRATGQSERTP